MLSLLKRLALPYKTAPLSLYTSFRTGGEALFAFPPSAEALCLLLSGCRERSLPFVMLGEGSNILAPDEGCDALIISTEKLCALSCSDNTLRAESGVLLKDLSGLAAEKSLSGLEFACGIPGSVGGAVYMNAGAYGGEVRQALESSEIFNLESLQKESLPASKHAFAYRCSVFQEGSYILLSSSFALKPCPQEEILQNMDLWTKQRQEKQPLEYASAGSTFKRPEGFFAGKLIADAGLQGCNINGAEVSTKHAGFIINKGGAKSADILALIAKVQDAVQEKFGVQLHPEVRILRKDGSFRP